MTIPDEVPVVTDVAEQYLNPKQLLDYRSERKECLSWLLTLGKKPEKGQGYALGTVKPRAYRMDQFYRWVWDQENGYTANITTSHADAWMKHLAQEDYSSTHKTNCQKAVKMLLKWKEQERGGGDWEPAIKFSDDAGSNPKDYLSRDERTQIRNASLEYGSIPEYSNVTTAERDRWERHLAQRFEKPKQDITRSDWERANSWKIPSPSVFS